MSDIGTLSGMTGFAILAIFPVCMIFATFFDIFTMTIPNRINLVLLGAFVVLAPLAGMDLVTMAKHAGVALVVLGVCFGFFAAGFMGAGDAKLLATSALWFGPSQTLLYIFLGGMLGGVLTLAIVFARRAPLGPRLSAIDWVARLHDSKNGVPYGAALGPAALYMFTLSPWYAFVATGLPIA